MEEQSFLSEYANIIILIIGLAIHIIIKFLAALGKYKRVFSFKTWLIDRDGKNIWYCVLSILYAIAFVMLVDMDVQQKIEIKGFVLDYMRTAYFLAGFGGTFLIGLLLKKYFPNS